MDDDLKKLIASLVDTISRQGSISTNLQCLHTIYNSCLQKVPVRAVEALVFKETFPQIAYIIDETFEQIKRTVTTPVLDHDVAKDLLETNIQLLRICQSAVEYIVNNNKMSIDVQYVDSVPVTLSNILLTTFAHCKNSNNFYGEHFPKLRDTLACLFKTAQYLQSRFLVALSTSISFSDDIDTLNSVLDTAAHIGKILPELNVKAMVDQWKGYAALTQCYSDELQDTIQISYPVRCLTNQIVTNMATIVDASDANDEHLNSTINTLKITNFLLKVVIKLCELFNDNPTLCHKDILLLLVTLNRYSTPYLHLNKCTAKVIDSVESHVTTASAVLLATFVNDERFIECFFRSGNRFVNDDDTKLGYMFLTLSMMKKILQSDGFADKDDANAEWIGDKFLRTIFDIVPLYHSHLMSNLTIRAYVETGQERRLQSLYEYVLTHIAAIAVNSSPVAFNNLEELLLKNVLQQNFWRALLAIDLWCILDRYSTEELTYVHVHYLIEIIITFGKSNYQLPESIFLNEITRRLFMLLTTDSKLKVLQQYTMEENLEIWRILELRNAPPGVVLQHDLNYAINKLSLRADSLKLKNCSADDWKYLCNSLLTLATLNANVMDESKLEQLINVLHKLWSFNFTSDLQTLKTNVLFKHLFTCLVRTTVGFIVYFNNAQLLIVLQQLRNHLTISPTVQLQTLQLLKMLSSKRIDNGPELSKILQLIGDVFNALLKEDDVFVREKSFETFANFVHVTKHEEIVAKTLRSDHMLQMAVSKYVQGNVEAKKRSDFNEYYKEQETATFKHICCRLRDDSKEEPLKKKAKAVSDVNMDVVLQRLKSDVDIVMEYCKNNDLTAETLLDLSETLQKLQILVCKND